LIRRSCDDNGWCEEPLAPMDVGSAYTLMSPERDGCMVVERWQHQARRFFSTDLSLSLSPRKSYPSGGWPLADATTVTVTDTRVELITLPLERAPAAIEAAWVAVDAIGGAGFDALLKRAQRVWQISTVCEGPDATAPLLLAAVLASLFLAPILPPGADTIFGVKGARERLARASSGD
jgi:hypothetical protein